jgi:sirohydrochlorin cobaltochelatase
MSDVVLTSATDKRAPMSSAPMKFADDGSVDWGNMWDTFCELAQAGGPPHRGTLLTAPAQPTLSGPAYEAAAAEIARGVRAVSGLEANTAEPGWLAVTCASAAQARWLAAAIVEENVSARAAGRTLYVPVDGAYTLTGEIKNVITVVAKTTHYWNAHVTPEAQRTLAAEAWLDDVSNKLRGLFKQS